MESMASGSSNSHWFTADKHSNATAFKYQTVPNRRTENLSWSKKFFKESNNYKHLQTYNMFTNYVFNLNGIIGNDAILVSKKVLEKTYQFWRKCLPKKRPCTYTRKFKNLGKTKLKKSKHPTTFLMNRVRQKKKKIRGHFLRLEFAELTCVCVMPQLL